MHFGRGTSEEVENRFSNGSWVEKCSKEEASFKAMLGFRSLDPVKFGYRGPEDFSKNCCEVQAPDQSLKLQSSPVSFGPDLVGPVLSIGVRFG